MLGRFFWRRGVYGRNKPGHDDRNRGAAKKRQRLVFGSHRHKQL
jgi:hypothetical protein